MRTSAKLCFTALAAAILLASAVSTASAGRLSVSNQQIRTVWSSLEFVGTATIRCRLTLEGSFHSRTITKIRETLIGHITNARFNACTGGRAWAANGVEVAPLGRLNNTLPWHITYEAFEGTLPAIEAVRLLLRRIRFVLEAVVFGLTCRGIYGNDTDRISGRATVGAGGAIETLSPISGRNSLNLVAQLGPNNACPGTGTFRGPAGDGRVTLLNSTTRITVTLI